MRRERMGLGHRRAVGTALVACGLVLAAIALCAPGPDRGTAAARTALAAGDLAYGQPGPHPAGWRRVRVAPEPGPAFYALVYYPAASAGQDAPVDETAAPCPAIAFGHGFFQEPARYAGVLAHLATWGFIVVASESQAGLSPDHAQFAQDLSASLAFLAQADADDGSPFYGRVRTDRFGASGHSMGGGASVLATAADERIRALANLAAAETRPSAVQAMGAVGVPVHLIVGGDDAIVPASATRRMYDAARPPRLMTTIVGGSHCGFESDPFPIGCDRGRLPAAEQLALTGHLLTAFFRLYLTDGGDWDAVWGPSEADPRLQRIADPGTGPTAATPAAATITPRPSVSPGPSTWPITPNGSATATQGVTPAATEPASSTADPAPPSPTAWPRSTPTGGAGAVVYLPRVARRGG